MMKSVGGDGNDLARVKNAEMETASYCCDKMNSFKIEMGKKTRETRGTWRRMIEKEMVKVGTTLHEFK